VYAGRELFYIRPRCSQGPGLRWSQNISSKESVATPILGNAVITLLIFCSINTQLSLMANTVYSSLRVYRQIYYARWHSTAPMKIAGTFRARQDLVDEVGKFYSLQPITKANIDTVKSTLHDYGMFKWIVYVHFLTIAMVRDYPLANKDSRSFCLARLEDDGIIFRPSPFIISSDDGLGRALMNDASLFSGLAQSVKSQMVLSNNHPILPPTKWRTRKYHNEDKKQKVLWKRFLIAMFGGVALVGPMLIMVLHKDLITTLTTVSVSIFLFAVILAVFSTESQNPETILVLAAAYAAVLVVFVGASS
jgi:hypothetical protein